MMEYLHAALLLHSADKSIEEASLSKVLKAAGVTADDARIKALVASLDGVDIEEAINTAGFAAAPVAAPTAAASGGPAETEAKDEKPKEEEKEEDLGLTSLFG